MEIALTSDHVGTNPTVISEWLSTHIIHGRNQSSHHDRMAQPLHLTCSSEWLWISALISVMEETNPLTMLEWIWDSSLSLRGNLDLENTKLLPEVIKLHSGQWLRQHIIYLIVRRNILELHDVNPI